MPSPIITIAQMRDWEQATWASGQTESAVIRQVGESIAERALRMTGPGELILLLAGKGHNGDDARAAIEHLADRRVEVLNVTDPAGDLARLGPLLTAQPSLIIDALFGIGINRPLSPEWVQFIQQVNETGAPVLAVDVPSGLNGDTGEPQGAAVRAAVTLTVGAPKVGLLQPAAWPYVGRLEVAAEVGLVPCPTTSELKWIAPQDFAGFPPRRAAATHKGDYGRLSIVAGSLGFHGAAVLASRGAQRAQPGLITLHTLESVYYPIAAQLQAVMVSIWNAAQTKLTGSYDAILLGPGLAAAEVPEQMRMLVRNCWRDAECPVIVDASALDWLPLEAPARNSVRVITPHPGEAARLLRSTPAQVQANRLNTLRNLSRRFGNTWVVLKGHETLIGRSTGEVFVNSSGNPHLAQGGSGDVLGGFIAGLLAQSALRRDPARTLCYAVWEHGATADYLDNTRPGWVVEDLVKTLGRAGLKP